ncbi:ribosome biogenesis GTPase YlqF [[Clostridium] spiroforme]|nr:ribosome biogenesis GTPase YlqF [Thomasclavelia spiroformis]MBM6880417.1 ribosome biogenesis GTPase YlqF [Thomasclavelia spiroformis]MBM6930498.1 ribosome biogenesis GTPase YlqF [Thomasclavelia spiroformis]
MAQIQWYPGHMAKAKREISDKMKLIDIVIELVDARAPYSSKNPLFNSVINNKPRLIVLTKEDLADAAITQLWLDYYKEKGYHAISVNLQNFNEYKKIIQVSKEILKDKMAREAKKGLKPRAMRAMILGIPNVGKSTFINRLAKRKATVTGNRPGVTKSQQIIKVDKDFELFDTPGVLWPKFESENIARNIALIGSIKQQILPREELFVYAVEYLVNHYPGMIEKRYGITVNLDTDWIEKCYDDIAISRKIKPVRAMTDYDRVMDVFFNDLFDGLMGNITWEKPHD